MFGCLKTLLMGLHVILVICVGAAAQSWAMGSLPCCVPPKGVWSAMGRWVDVGSCAGELLAN